MKYIKIFNTNEEKQEFEQTVDYWPIVTLTKNGQETVGDLNYYDEDDIVNDDSGNTTTSIFPLSITYNSSSNYTELYNTLKSYIEDNCVNTAPEGFYQYTLFLNPDDIILSKNSKTYNISCVMLSSQPDNLLYIDFFETQGQMPYWQISSKGKIVEYD
jgi:hypothetical protein